MFCVKIKIVSAIVFIGFMTSDKQYVHLKVKSRWEDRHDNYPYKVREVG
jgi:hypothetical protein